MIKLNTILMVGALMLPAFGTLGCSSADCTSLCEDGQAGNCTSIKGDCGAFCDAAEATNDDAGCTSLYDSYVDCLNSTGDVCDAGCDSEESAYTNCMGTYCLNNTSDPNCTTLINSF